ncbi:MAG: ABC transporter ATP-binding protein [Acidimicrobiia bacterium]|nr:ABC transporter ATP-binding protein [Acidimicrobiia bacterium]
MLKVDGLRKTFHDLVAVDDLSFTIAEGETFGLLGPNGAGKTTAISMVCGLLEPDAGSVTVDGVTIEPGSTRGRELIGLVPQELALYTDMNGWDNLAFFARLYGLRGSAAKARIEEVLAVVGLSDRARDKVEEYSGGMQRRLNIAAGMLHRPKLLILDEPTVGIDPQSRNAILDAVAELGTTGMSVLYTTHYMEEAERLCQRVGIVDHGQMLACGTRRELVSMVDQHDKVRISIGGATDGAVDALAQHEGVVAASLVDDHTIECLVDNAAQLLPDMIADLGGRKLSVTEIQVVEPSLDSVFLHITGTALRD